jgi:tetratricopeptide (TPR) repeat protein/NAD-dependent dihydropyrimidine dehydrogenase PreA subunit
MKGSTAVRIGASDRAESDLPVLAPTIRRSRTGKWRAGVLVAVHLLIVAHVTHYLVRGRTLSPVEPSESMYTLELGEVNAGFVFFLVAIAATAVAGRFFCGWGCHIVALQDLCGWLMKKLGVRPRPFRSRLLLWVPLGLAAYMFLWPTVKRLLTWSAARAGWVEALAARDWLDLVVELGLLYPPGGPVFRGFTNHLMTDAFWKTFPTPLWAALTFASCGFAAVYFLGAKGFCTYGCPYGALFVAVDRLAPVRIVVDPDRCEGCAHCTATCTSNVLVHEEVRRFGMVVDPGCMKCMDCISVCPTDALRLGVARPSLLRGEPADDRTVPRFRLSRGRELLALAVGIIATLCLRGHYDRFPLLMSVGVGAITGFLALKLLELWRDPTVRLQNRTLKLAGRWGRDGRVFAALGGLWLVVVADSGWVQWHRKWGAYHLERTEANRAEVLAGRHLERDYSERHRRAAAGARRHFELADRLDPLGIVEIKLGRAWGYLLGGDVERGAAQIRAALELEPSNRGLYDDLIALLANAGQLDQALAVAGARAQAVGEISATELLQRAGLALEVGRIDEVPAYLDRARALADDNAPQLAELGMAYLAVGQPERAGEALLRALELDPSSAELHFRYAGLLVQTGRMGEAVAAYRACLELAPDAPEARYNLGGVLRRLGRTGEAIAELERARELAPGDPAVALELAEAYAVAGREPEALALLRQAAEIGRGTGAEATLTTAIQHLERRLGLSD